MARRLLFILGFVAVFSLSLLLTLPFSFWWQQAGQFEPKLQALSLSEVEGGLMQGQATVQAADDLTPLGVDKAAQQRLQAVPAVRAQWQNSLFPLVKNIQLQGSWLQAQASAVIDSLAQQQVSLRAERIDLPVLSELFSNQQLPVKPEAGELIISGLEMTVAQSWPQALQGRGAVQNLKIMGVAMPLIEWQLKMAQPAGAIDLTLNSQAQGQWQLTGVGQITPEGVYELTLTLDLVKADALPDWGYVMRRTEANQYQSVMKGRFK